MKSPLRVALAGLGRIAWRFDEPSTEFARTHAGAYERSERTQLVGGCSPESRDREDFCAAYGVPAYATLDELLSATRPDIVSVCTPSELHFEHALRCLEAGVRGVWLEKPPANSARDLERLCAARGTAQVLVGFQRRYVQAYEWLKEWCRVETFGACRHAAVTYSRGLELNGCHLLDALFFVLGDPGTPELVWASSDVESPSFVLRFGSGLEVQVSGMVLPYHCLDLTLTCDGGRASIVHGGLGVRVEERVEHELFPGFHRLRDLRPPADLAKPGFGDSLMRGLEDLLNAIGGGPPARSNLTTALATQRVVDAIRDAQANRVGS